MATKWRALNTGRLFPNELRTAGEKVSELADGVESALAVTQSAMQAFVALLSTIDADPFEAIARALIDEILALLDGLATDTGAHAILLPIQKSFFGLGQRTPAEELDPNATSISFDTLIADGGFKDTAIADIPLETADFINGTDAAVGGVQGYYRTLVQSLYDEGDLARPTFPNTYAVTGISIVWGSQALDDLNKIFDLFSQFVFLGGKADPSARTRPTVQNVTARVAPIPTEGRIGVIVEWEPVPRVILPTLYTSETLVNDEIFIIRSTDSKIRQRFSWIANFPAQPSAEQSDLPENGNTKVIARLTNDGFLTSYVDNDPELSVDVTYYYALALRYEIRADLQSTGVIQPMGPLSSVRQVFYTQRPQTTLKSQAPDWYATPSLIELFPVIQDYLSIIRLFVESFLVRTTINSGLVNMIEQVIASIEDLANELARINDELRRLSELLTSLSNADLGSVAVTHISVNSGGMQGWTAELAKRLSDPSDSSRPQFTDSDLTGGLVIVAGGPGPSDVTVTSSLLELFFGGSGDSATQDTVIDLFGPATTSRTASFASGSADRTFSSEPDSDDISARNLFETGGGTSALDPVTLAPRLDFADDFTATRTTEPEAAATPVFDEQMNPSQTDCD